jgi:glyoxylase-like metal-dependent hydrolase (beta-lactamase superfamily II)
LPVLADRGGAIWGYRRATDLEVAQVTDDVHVIYGFGGNVGVLAHRPRRVVVDTMTFRTQGARILELAEQLGGGPVQAIVNTHYHMDHTHGNPAFPAGTRVISTDARSPT